MNYAHSSQFANLFALAQNYYWSWKHDIWDLFARTNPEVWETTKCPMKTLLATTDAQWELLSQDSEFIDRMNFQHHLMQEYLNKNNHWFGLNYPSFERTNPIAYFSAEYGIHESLPIYSGGLGILSGDHVKAASDLGIPMMFFGLFYKEGYFTQEIDKNGQQVDKYIQRTPSEMGLIPVMKDGQPVLLSVKLAGREVFFTAYQAHVGRSILTLLDTDVEQNSKEDRAITYRLYGGDRAMRISQEIVLGMGGIKLLRLLNITPSAYHMNEGHSAFFQIERIKNAICDFSLSFRQAQTLCAANCVFTTHTPVPAGNEAFDLNLMHEYFFEFCDELKISWADFLSLGIQSHSSDYKYFSMTVLAINTSRFFNGVSELHGHIASKMWMDQWRDVPVFENPMTSITNGVHVETWTSPEVKALFDQVLSHSWRDEISNQDFWDKAKNIPQEKVKEITKHSKEKLISLVRTRLKDQYLRHKLSKKEIDQVDSFLSPDTLTIGFARRFATYKRATLLFNNEKRLQKILNNKKMPVQFVFAGKAHPADKPGQAFIKEIHRLSLKPEYRGKIILLENYDMNISRHMVAGVDVWLNTPRRPMEACGTSGQKVPINLGINFSVLDGWWREGHNGKNGWGIGEEKDFPSDEQQDIEDANDLYNTLEELIMPLYYQKPKEWFKVQMESLRTNLARFSARRMVEDYTKLAYIPCAHNGEKFYNDFDLIASYTDTRSFLKRNWPAIMFKEVKHSKNLVEGKSLFRRFKKTPSHHVDFPITVSTPGRVFKAQTGTLTASIYLGAITTDMVRVEAILSHKDAKMHEIVEMKQLKAESEKGIATFSAELKVKKADQQLRIRVVPVFEDQLHKFEFGMSAWY